MGENCKAPYVSLIKIDGKPILPPLITQELRKELVRYKQQAVKLEQRLKNCRALKTLLDEHLETQSNTTRPLSQLTFGDNSHIEALDISVPRKLKNIHLSQDLIDVTQYNADGLKTICSNTTLVDKACDIDENTLHKPSTPPKPRLIRSNSYTLEAPSPILLEHLKKTSCQEFNDNSLASSRNWSSLENNLESSDLSSIDTVFHKEISDRSEAPSSPDKSAKVIAEIKSPTIEVYQTDISVQQITVNTNSVAPNGSSKEEKREAFFTKNPFDVFEPDSELLNVLKDIPDTYANQIIELLRKQHVEQKNRLERYENFNADNPTQELPLPPSQNGENDYNLIDLTSFNKDSHLSRPNTAESCLNSIKPLRRSSTFSVSPSQSLYYSITSDSDTLPAGAGDVNVPEIGVLRQKNGYWEGILKHENSKELTCSRELFPELDPVTISAMKQEWAASIIGAHVKGYLTRRLIKTDKVQAVIATVKDVLMCALELHQSANIDEKDVELHRRLINQLSAALYAFHDIFFELTTPEQMLIIAADRQRKREKLKRPQSGRSSTRSKSSSSSRSNKSSNSSRPSSKHKLISESPSLTKV